MKTIITLFIFTTFLACRFPHSQRLAVLTKATESNLSATNDAHDARASHTATLLRNGKVLLAGGMARNDVFTASAELFDPTSGTFSPTKNSMTAPRVGHTATLLPDGKVLLVGGWAGGWNCEASADLYDPATNTFTRISPMKQGRADHSATLLNNGRVLIAGGAAGRQQLQSAELYDPQSGAFTPAAALLGKRSGHSASLLADGTVLLAGGQSDQDKVLSSAEIFSPQANQFAATGVLKTVRYKHAAVLLPSGKVLVVGGSDHRDWQGRYITTELYDPKTGTFQSAASLNAPRYKISSAVVRLPDGKVLIAGGAEQVELYDPATNQFALVSGSLEQSWHFASSTLLADGRALIVGGYAFGSRERGPLSTTKAWIYKT